MAMGVPDRVVADILGHAQVRVTQEHYLHSTAAQRLDALTTAATQLLAPVELPEWRLRLTVETIDGQTVTRDTVVQAHTLTKAMIGAETALAAGEALVGVTRA